LALSTKLWSQAPAVQPQYQPEFFSFQEVVVPVRDGLGRQTVILTPKYAMDRCPSFFVAPLRACQKDANAIPGS